MYEGVFTVTHILVIFKYYSIVQQSQKKLPYIEAKYRSRTQPSAKFNLSKMESVQPTSYQLPPLNEVPLSSLVSLNFLVVFIVILLVIMFIFLY